MKFRLTLLLLILIQFSYAQIQDSIKSHEIEIEGWKFYFDENKKEAKWKFVKAIELDSTNVLAKIGLFNTKDESELNENDFEFVERLPTKGNYKDIMFKLMLANQTDKQIQDSIKIARNTYDASYIKFKALLTDSEFQVFDEKGNIRETGNYKNRKPSGIWNFFGYQNKLHHSFTFPKKGDTVVVSYYKADEDIIRQEWRTGTPFKNQRKIKEVIFWQKNPGKTPEYLFVSKKGFKIYDSENPVEFDETTPDNFIQRKWNPEKKAFEAIIWKNGKQEPYEICEDDGMIAIEIRDGVRKKYRWENCKKIEIEN